MKLPTLPFTSGRTLAALFTITALGIAVTACSAQGRDSGGGDPERPNIVVTTSVMGDVVAEVAGKEADVTVLIPPGSDPHEFQPSTRDIQLLHSADLVFTVGHGFEEALEPQLDAAAGDGVELITLLEHVDPLEITTLYAEHDSQESNEEGNDHADDHDHAHHDHDHDHDHGSVDPHFWHDPQRVSLAVATIADELAKLDGVDAAALMQRAEEYREALDELDAALEEQFASIPEDARKLVTQHNVLGYLAVRYDFEIVGSLIPSTSTLAQSSASRVNAIVERIRATGARAVFTDVTQSEALARTIAQEVSRDGAVLVVPLYTESLSDSGGDAASYIEMMRTNAERITEALAD